MYSDVTTYLHWVPTNHNYINIVTSDNAVFTDVEQHTAFNSPYFIYAFGLNVDMKCYCLKTDMQGILRLIKLGMHLIIHPKMSAIHPNVLCELLFTANDVSTAIHPHMLYQRLFTRRCCINGYSPTYVVSTAIQPHMLYWLIMTRVYHIDVSYPVYFT